MGSQRPAVSWYKGVLVESGEGSGERKERSSEECLKRSELIKVAIVDHPTSSRRGCVANLRLIRVRKEKILLLAYEVGLISTTIQSTVG